MDLKNIFIPIFMLFFFNSFLVIAADKNVEFNETGLWNGAYLKFKLSDKFGYYGEHHYRLRNSKDNLYDFLGRNRQIYNRAGLNIFFNKNFEAVIGPTLVLNFSPDNSNPDFNTITYEPRIWHQYLFKMPKMFNSIIFHQFRFEHRWKKSNLKGADFVYTNRYRYKFFAYIPLNTEDIEVGTFFVSPSFEIFMHTGENIIFNPFEDFRTYNGIGYVLNENVTFFAGHMWTLGQAASGYEYNTKHILRLNVFLGFDWRKDNDKIPQINIGY